MALLVGLTFSPLYAQRPGPKDPSRMVQREKQLVLSEVSKLNDSQKEEITMLYDAMSLEVDQKMASAESARKETRKELRGNLNDRLKETLSAEQYEQYEKLIKERQERYGKRRRGGDSK